MAKLVGSATVALKITEECINCDVCEPQCPNTAIFMGEEHYVIDPLRCTQCVGHFDEPQCSLLCPVECIIEDQNCQDSSEQLLEKFRALTQANGSCSKG